VRPLLRQSCMVRFREGCSDVRRHYHFGQQRTGDYQFSVF
jgi:hypothetical protein